jgi:hypothetical protein
MVNSLKDGRGMSRDGYEKTLRMILGADRKDLISCLLKNLSETENTDLQLHMLGIIASKRDKNLLPEVEKAFQGFEERHRKYLQQVLAWIGEHFEPRISTMSAECAKARELSDKISLERNLAAARFWLAFYLNVLGKDNGAEIREFMDKHDFGIPHLAVGCIMINDGRVMWDTISQSDFIVKMIKSDPDNVLAPKLREVMEKVLAQEYLWNATVAKPTDAPVLPFAPDHPEWADIYWPELVKALVDTGDKEFVKSAASALDKHAANATENLFQLAFLLRDADRPAVAESLKKYFTENRSSLQVDISVWSSAANLAARLTECSFENPPRSMKERQAQTDAILAKLDSKIAE